MQNHRQDDVSSDPREKWRAAGANDDLAFLMAMLALAEGAGTLERPVETFEQDLGDSVHEKAKSSDKAERAVAKVVMDLDSSD